jgi:FMNH2-dependent dimethyl sulfone monooxygenase
MPQVSRPKLAESTALAPFEHQPMLLGLFLPFHAGGWSLSSAPRGTDWTFEYNSRLTRRAEEIGFDLAFAPSHWLPKDGYGGRTRYRHTSLDAFIGMAGLAAVTKRILLLSTVNVLYGPLHPLHLAKFGATIDHISGGRWGVNVVTGFLPNEARMFGQEQHQHDLRYEMAGEFTEMMVRLMTAEDNLSLGGSFWHTEEAFVTPKPAKGRPLIVNATGSPAGIGFAARYSDIVFVTSPKSPAIEDALTSMPPFIRSIHEAAAREGRRVKVLTNPMILCRETEKEVREAHQRILTEGDDEAVSGFFSMTSGSDAWNTKAWESQEYKKRRDQRVLGGNIQIIGTPEQVVDQILDLKKAGIDGIQICFYDFEPELEFFSANVVPLLRQAQLRL